MEISVQCQKLCQLEKRSLVIVMAIIVSAIVIIQSLALPSRHALSSLFPAATVPVIINKSYGTEKSSSEPRQFVELNSADIVNSKDLPAPKSVKKTYSPDKGGAAHPKTEIEENESESDIGIDLDEDTDPGDGLGLAEERDPVGEILEGKITKQDDDVKSEKVADADNVFMHKRHSSNEEKTAKQGDRFSLDTVRKLDANVVVQVTHNEQGDMNQNEPNHLSSNFSNSLMSIVPNTSSFNKQVTKITPDTENMGLLLSDEGSTSGNSTTSGVTAIKKKKKQILPPTSIPEMDRMLMRSRAKYHTMKPRWSSPRDQEILSIKAQINHSPILGNDRVLYAPIFRNVSMFKRSYELMERTLKVYVYKEGGKPIYHTPILKGLYASEGWFMRLMEGSRHFRVKDPRKAHLFYMPFSSRFLQYTLYVPGSHNSKNLRDHLDNYVGSIAAKYPFWNRTGGTDHFVVACHDWAPYETRNSMERCVRALCNADLNEGFKMGKDVSLPETYVRSPQNPLRDIGGKPADKRSTLAFFAGNMHGALRTILLQHWENKDPDMKIFGPMPKGSKRKPTYSQYMKTSKYCICPRGYEVNSPRVVEAILYECVPVIISDNFVPPFFEVLNWEAFAVFVAEKDIPRLKDILLSIPEEKYRSMQMTVKKVQQHFLWHSRPVKYDIFHMILHSIWLNRVYTLRTR